MALDASQHYVSRSVRVETDQVARVRAAFEAVRDFVREATMRFSPGGVTLVAMDNAHVVMIVFDMTRDAVTHSGGAITVERGDPCPDAKRECIEVGVDTRAVSQCLRGSAHAETVAFEVDAAKPEAIVIECRSCGGTSIMRWSVCAPTPDDDAVRMNARLLQIHYPGSVTMSSTTFQEVVRNIASCDSELVELECDGTTLHFAGSGLLTSASYAMKPTTVVKSTSGKSPWPTRQSFLVSYLARIAKAKSVGRQVQLFMRQGCAMFVAYDSPIGTLRFVLMPAEAASAATAMTEGGGDAGADAGEEGGGREGGDEARPPERKRRKENK